MNFDSRRLTRCGKCEKAMSVSASLSRSVTLIHHSKHKRQKIMQLKSELSISWSARPQREWAEQIFLFTSIGSAKRPVISMNSPLELCHLKYRGSWECKKIPRSDPILKFHSNSVRLWSLVNPLSHGIQWEAFWGHRMHLWLCSLDVVVLDYMLRSPRVDLLARVWSRKWDEKVNLRRCFASRSRISQQKPLEGAPGARMGGRNMSLTTARQSKKLFFFSQPSGESSRRMRHGSGKGKFTNQQSEAIFVYVIRVKRVKIIAHRKIHTNKPA